VSGQIVALVPAQPGWWAYYTGEFPEDAGSTRVVAWALVESDEGVRDVTGLVISDGDPTRVAPATEWDSAVATEFSRYGFEPE